MNLFRFHRARVLLLWLGGTLVFGCRGKADDILPKATPVSKYAKMASHSPFAPPTAPVMAQATPPPPPVPGWADNLTATNVAQWGSKYFVTVVDAQNPQHLYLASDPDAETQMSVASVKWGTTHDDPPTVTLRKGTEFAQVRYEAGAASPGGSNTLGGGNPPIPGATFRPPVPGAPVAPGTQAFHPPPLPNAAAAANPGPSSLRRPLIRSQPNAPAQPVGRPAVNQPTTGARPNPAVHVDDDDDDD